MPKNRLLSVLACFLLAACGSFDEGDPECVGDDCGVEPGPGPEPIEDGMPPSVLSISPELGSTDIASTDPIVIAFSEPMSPESTLASVSISPDAPLLSHDWNQDFTELTLRFGLADAEAVYPEEPGINEYAVTVSIVAEDTTGNELGEAVMASFTTRRYQIHNFDPLGALGGHATEACPTCRYSFVGAGDYGGNRWHGYMTFDVSEFPSALLGDVESAIIDSHLRLIEGDPFGSFGDLHIAHSSFDSRAAAVTAPVFREYGVLIPASAAEEKGQYLADVTPAFREDIGDRIERQGYSQYLLTFPNAPTAYTGGNFTWLYVNPDRAAEQGVPNTVLSIRTRY
ncbi:MAG: Ig-like domain-containing protein [Deltaproteobacteria bacterium]|nr:Ig-like domain-containing protein [Deltaproteobacteria bacterium]